MEYKDIKKIMEDMGDSKLDSLEIEFPDGIKISMTKGGNKQMIYSAPIEAGAPLTVPTVIPEQETHLTVQNKQASTNDGAQAIKSPMVGTFYASASPEAPAFVKVGDKVKKGQVVCIIEAMKLMNEIESEFDGEIVEVCLNNQDMVEFGSPLFKIK